MGTQAQRGACWKEVTAATRKDAEEAEQLVSYNDPGAHGAAVVQTINDELAQHADFGVTAGLYTEPHGFLNSTFAHFQYDFHLAESMARRLVRMQTRGAFHISRARQSIFCLLYTSDAADE